MQQKPIKVKPGIFQHVSDIHSGLSMSENALVKPGNEATTKELRLRAKDSAKYDVAAQ